MAIAVQIRFRAKSNLAQDDAINTWAFGGTDDAGTQSSTALTRLSNFYNTETGGVTVKFTEYLASTHYTDSVQFKSYDLSDPEPRVPIDEQDFAWTESTPASTGNLPTEVAYVLSFEAAQVSGVPAARRRGRVYLGPLNLAAADSTANVYARPATAFRANINILADQLLAASTAGTAWGVWSRVDSVVRPVVSGWGDNAWDIQRRRGVAATSRNTFA